MSCLPYWPLTNITVNDATKINANFTGLVACIAEGTGATGLQGLTGLRGETGPFGGPQGETGIQGVTGLANFTRGSSFPAAPQDLQLYWDNEDEIVYFYDDVNAKAWLDISSGTLGMSGLQGETGLNITFTRGSAFPSSPLDLHLYWDNEDEIVYFYDDVNAKAWLDISSGTLGMSGLQGDTGVQGVRGLTGPAGGVTGMINANFKGAAYNLVAGTTHDFKVPFDLQIDQWWIYGLTGGSALFNVSKCTDAGYPGSFGLMHSGETGPNTSVSVKNNGTTSTWSSPTAAQGDIIRLAVIGSTGMPGCTLSINYRKIS